MLQANFVRFFHARSLNLLWFLKIFHACIHATYKMFMQARLRFLLNTSRTVTVVQVKTKCPQIPLGPSIIVIKISLTKSWLQNVYNFWSNLLLQTKASRRIAEPYGYQCQGKKE